VQVPTCKSGYRDFIQLLTQFRWPLGIIPHPSTRRKTKCLVIILSHIAKNSLTPKQSSCRTHHPANWIFHFTVPFPTVNLFDDLYNITEDYVIVSLLSFLIHFESRMFESLHKHILVLILQYHTYNIYYELCCTYTRLIILILVYCIIQLSLLLCSTSLSDPFSSFGMGYLRVTYYTNEWCNYMESRYIRS